MLFSFIRGAGGGEAFEYTRGRFAFPFFMRVYRDHSFPGDETNPDNRMDFWMYFGFVYGILQA
jgi:hypothetical protein